MIARWTSLCKCHWQVRESESNLFLSFSTNCICVYEILLLRFWITISVVIGSAMGSPTPVMSILHCLGESYTLLILKCCISLLGFRLDIGDGKEIDLKVCPRIKLCQECIQYLGPVCSRAWKLGEFIIMILCFHSNSALSSPFHTSSAHDKFAWSI